MVRTEPRRNSEQIEPLTPAQPLPALQQPLFVGVPGHGAPLAAQALPWPHATQGFYGVPAFAGLPPATLAALQGLSYGIPTGPFLAPFGFPSQFTLGNVVGAPVQGLPIGPQLPTHAPTAPSIGAAIQDLGREVVATFEVPGVAVEDLQVIVGNTTVSITAQRPAANGRVYQGSFQLPAEVLPSQASARLQHGLLILTLPRRTPTEEPRRVEVEA
ncbi:MAG TPA: Hsp20/alpha crystallin family protein [Candidatus Thermoplasmatota archaeon]|nr:Hsp20/alpha crystallin family protein [Candidatus Thermoplasmatota archaeon]